MRRSRLWMCALAIVATFGCKQVSEQYAKVQDQFAKLKEAIAAKIAARRGLRPTPQPAAPVAQTPTPPPAPATPVPSQTPGARVRPGGDLAERPQAPAVPRAVRDEPFQSPDTGTIAPGMSEREIYQLWGAPADVRHQGEWTFLYFRNGCEYTCGTADVVFLKKGQVVDAVLRWPGHGYSGQSSSPAATPPHGPTKPGGDTLSVKPSSPSSP